MQITEILRNKGADVTTVTPDISVRELITLLADRNIGAVVVSPDGEIVQGIVSERDVVRRLRSGAGLLDTPVSEIMTSDVQTVDPSVTVHELSRLMTERRIRHVPVLVEGRLAGLVSIGDVVKSRIGELEFEREQLEHYIITSR